MKFLGGKEHVNVLYLTLKLNSTFENIFMTSSPIYLTQYSFHPTKERVLLLEYAF